MARLADCPEWYLRHTCCEARRRCLEGLPKGCLAGEASNNTCTKMCEVADESEAPPSGAVGATRIHREVLRALVLLWYILLRWRTCSCNEGRIHTTLVQGTQPILPIDTEG